MSEKQKLLDFLAETQKSYTEDYIEMFDHEDAWDLARQHYKALISERLVRVFATWNAGYVEQNAHSIRASTQAKAESILEAWDITLWYADLEEISS